MAICTITFLASDPVFIHLGPIEIRWYALGYIFGLVLGAVYAKALVRSRSLWIEPPGTAADIDDLLVWVALGVIVGGRLGQVFLYEPRFFFTHPLEIPKLWHGGMSFHGGFVGATLAIILFARHQGISILSYLDMCAAVTPIGLFLVRLANFVNGELWGRISDCPWAVAFPAAGALPRHPSQIYEAILEGLVLFFLLLFLVRLKALKRPRNRSKKNRSEEHTSELQSHLNLVCRLLLEKKKKKSITQTYLYSLTRVRAREIMYESCHWTWMETYSAVMYHGVISAVSYTMMNLYRTRICE